MARAVADETVTRTVAAGFSWQAAWALAARARIAHADAEPDRARDLAHRSLALRHRIADRGGIADSLELLAILTSGQDELSEAARLLGAATAAREAAGCCRLPMYEAAVAHARIRSELGLEDFDAALAEGRALSCAEAVSYAGRGRGQRGRPSHGWAALTPVERNVVGLVSTGLSNKEIAARLFVSPRTVGAHLYNVYTKLGVNSRMQVAHEAARRYGSGDPG